MTEEMKKEKCNSQASAMNKNEQLFLQTALNLMQKPRQIHLGLKTGSECWTPIKEEKLKRDFLSLKPKGLPSIST